MQKVVQRVIKWLYHERHDTKIAVVAQPHQGDYVLMLHLTATKLSK